MQLMRPLKLFSIGLCLFIALFSCKKDESNIGAYISQNPNQIAAEINDTFHIVTYSKKLDSVITSGKSSIMLGSINTSEAGLSESSIFSSLIPDSLNRTFPSSNYQIDSFYIELEISNVYGKNISQEFEIYKIDEHVNEDSVYYNFDSLTVGEKIGSIFINVEDSGVYQFNLDYSAAHHLMTSDNEDYLSNDAFKSFFGGIYIVPSTPPSINEGAIYQLNPKGISIHLSFSTTNGMDDIYDNNIVYSVENERNIFAKFHHDFNDSEVKDVFNDSTLGQQAFYVQGLSGSNGKIKFPTVQNWFNNDSSNYLVTDFDLIIYAVDNSSFTLPEQLVFTYTSSLGIRTYKSGFLNSEDNSYSFQISNAEVNKALESNEFNLMDFEISHPFPGNNPDQVKLLGVSSDSPPNLLISYTKY